MTFNRLFIAMVVVLFSAGYGLRGQRSGGGEPAARAMASVPKRPTVPPSTSAMAVAVTLDAEANQCTPITLVNGSGDPIEVEFAKAPGLTFFRDPSCMIKTAAKASFPAGNKVYYFTSRVLFDENIRFATSEGILFETRLVVRRDRKLDPMGNGQTARVRSARGEQGAFDAKSAVDSALAFGVGAERPSQIEGRLLDYVGTSKQICFVDRAGVSCAVKMNGVVGTFAKMELPASRVYDLDGDSDQTVCAATDKGIFCWGADRQATLHALDSSEAVLNVAVNDGNRVCGLTQNGKIACEIEGTTYVLVTRGKELFQGLTSRGSLVIAGVDGKVKVVSDSNATDNAYCEVEGVKNPSEVVTFAGSSPCDRGCVRNSSELRCWREAQNHIATPRTLAEFL